MQEEHGKINVADICTKRVDKASLPRLLQRFQLRLSTSSIWCVAWAFRVHVAQGNHVNSAVLQEGFGEVSWLLHVVDDVVLFH